jgi:hypothetical protein
VAPLGAGDDFTLQVVQGGKERHGAVAVVVMGVGLKAAGVERQAGLGALEGLDLTFLIAAEHQGLVGRREVQTNHIPELGFKSRIGRELKGAREVGFEVVLSPEFLHRAFAHAGVARHRTHAPAGARGRGLDHLAQGHLLRVESAGASRPGLVFQGRQAGAGVTVAPLAHRVDVQADVGRDLLIGPALGRQQHHPGTLLVAALDPTGLSALLEYLPLIGMQSNLRGRPRHASPYPGSDLSSTYFKDTRLALPLLVGGTNRIWPRASNAERSLLPISSQVPFGSRTRSKFAASALIS